MDALEEVPSALAAHHFKYIYETYLFVYLLLGVISISKTLNYKLSTKIIIKMALEITTENFKELTSKENELVVADFWAEWCGPCKMIGPVIDELSQEYAGKAIIGKVNVEEQGDLAVQFGVRNIPTILFIKNGEVVDKQVGAAPKAALVDMINKHI